MHTVSLSFFGAIALVWLSYGLRVAIGAMQLPWLRDFRPAGDEACPKVSLLFAARDEAQKLPVALETMLTMDYPGLEIVAVDDRSTDGTAQILDAFAANDSRLKVVHLKELPEGWLGKPHALQRAYEASSGDWLLFTDADVRFKSDTLRRAAALAGERELDHLTLMCEVEMHGFWEKAVLTFFGLGFHLATNPRGVSDSRSRAYIGIGAFQMVKRSAYEASGTHRRLAMEVLDDMKLAKIVKQAGFRSAVGIAQDYVSVRWHAGLGNIVGGVTKNFFAGAGFRLGIVAAQLAGIICMNVVPFVALPFVKGWAFAFVLAALAVAISFHAGAALVMKASPLYAFTQPLGAAIFSYMLLRSTVVTLRQGGIVWRDTFYPLEKLRKGLV
jgi:glycosyltransferase involved in cell wall biosynthesis